MRVQLGETAAQRLKATASPTLGILLGQISAPQCYDVVYLARTPEDRCERVEDETGEKSCAAVDLRQVQEGWVADHAVYVTRMLPGGMFVLGIFVSCPEDVFNDKTLFAKIKNILTCTNKALSADPYLFGVPTDCDTRLVMHCSNGKISCRTVDLANAFQTKPIDVNSKCDLKKWQRLDCYHEFDESYYVAANNASTLSVREQFQKILAFANDSLESSLVFLDGKLRNGTDSIESFTRKAKKGKASSADDEENAINSIQVSTLSQCNTPMSDTVEYLECDGLTHFSGVVASRVYVNPKATIDVAIAAVKQDIVRSLATRFTMHCDALISDNLLPEEKICFNEPPRRVLIRIPDLSEGDIYFCDYLFPGESPEEALGTVKDMLDVDIVEEDVISNIETPADTSEFDAIDKGPSIENTLTAPQDAKRMLIALPFALALLIGMIAIVLQYFYR